jgi:hypothetical protein
MAFSFSIAVVKSTTRFFTKTFLIETDANGSLPKELDEACQYIGPKRLVWLLAPIPNTLRLDHVLDLATCLFLFDGHTLENGEDGSQRRCARDS